MLNKIRTSILLGLLLSGLAAQAAFAQDPTVAEVQQVIAEKHLAWTAGETTVSAMSAEQRKHLVGGLKGPAGSAPAWQPSVKMASLPAAFDWRDSNGKNYVTPVRNQGQCGSCYIFGTVAALESQLLLKYARPGTDLNLSEQIPLACDSAAGNCTAGGYASMIATYLHDTGTALETCYPYIAAEGDCGDACANWQRAPFRLDSYTDLSDRTEEEITTALMTTGPLTVWMRVYADFDHYTGGVYSYATGEDKGGHFILLVGWDDAQSAFLCKNSWGTGWGESGYFWIAYSQMQNSVGFASYALALSGGVWPMVTSAPLELLLLNGQ